jgi:hypothetical protein
MKKTIKISDNDIALIGKCVIHPDKKFKMVKWRDVYYYMDSGAIKHWEQDKLVYFFPDKAHAFYIKDFNNK